MHNTKQKLLHYADREFKGHFLHLHMLLNRLLSIEWNANVI